MDAYILKHHDDEIRKSSRSGGVFTALTDYILRCGGVVYGCRLDEKFAAVHDRATTTEERDAFRKSKYIQSELGETFRSVRNDLQNGRKVLFSGTPCQVAGLKSFLGKMPMDNLWCVDIICHGVPSPKVWQDYLEFCRTQYGGEIEKIEFINKERFGWAAHKESIWIDGVEYDDNVFTNLFGGHNIVRPACFQCPYKCLDRVGDVTIGDAWGGTKTVDKDFNDNRGVSLVLVNSLKGKEIFNSILSECTVRDADIKHYMQHPLIGAYDVPTERKKFWKIYNRRGFQGVYKYYVRPNLFRKAIRKIVRIIRG